MQIDSATPSLSIPVDDKEMISVTNDSGKTTVKINSSSLSVLQECPRKSNYLLYNKFHKKSQSPAVLFGSAIHAALEVFYNSSRADRTLPKNYKTVIQDLENMEAPEDHLLYKSAKAFVDKAEPLRNIPPSDKRSLQAGLWSLAHYFETYIDDPFVVMEDKDGPIVERRVEYKLYESEKMDIVYFGTIDVVLKNQRTNQILVCDHKTSSIVGNDFFNRLKPNHQYTGYLLGAKECLGIKTDSFLVNCIQVKPKPVTSRGKPPHFLRQVTRRDETDYVEFRQAVMYWVRQYLDWIAGDYWPLGHTNACSSYGGCQYLSVCSAPTEIRDNIINAEFERTNNEKH